MGKRIISQARGKGSKTYRVRRIAYRFRLAYLREMSGEGTVVKLLNSRGHTAPLAKIACAQGSFFMPAFNGMVEGQKIKLDSDEIKDGNIVRLKNVPMKTKVYNIEAKPRDGGKFIKTAGTSAEINRIIGENVFIILPSKKERKFHPECRATIGVIAGSGRLDKPLVKAGKKHHMSKARNKLWPRTSAVKMNAIDHPFGSGRGKNPKSKIAKRNAPPGRKVGHLRPRRTGRKNKMEIKKKEFTYRGKTVEELKKLDVREFAKFLSSRSRRAALRQFQDIENFVSRCKKKEENDKKIRTHKRNLIIVPKMIGMKIQIHNGNKFLPLEVTGEMLGHRLGEFSPTRNRVKHGKSGVGSTKGSKSKAKK